MLIDLRPSGNNAGFQDVVYGVRTVIRTFSFRVLRFLFLFVIAAVGCTIVLSW